MSDWHLPEIPGAKWSDGCIYYILSGETGRIKIGFTNSSPLRRLKALQTGSPTRMSVVAVHPGDRDCERRLHEQFAKDRVHGEWFDVSDDMLVHMMGVYSLTIAIYRNAGEPDPAWAVAGRKAILHLCDLADEDTVH